MGVDDSHGLGEHFVFFKSGRPDLIILAQHFDDFPTEKVGELLGLLLKSRNRIIGGCLFDLCFCFFKLRLQFGHFLSVILFDQLANFSFQSNLVLIFLLFGVLPPDRPSHRRLPLHLRRLVLVALHYDSVAADVLRLASAEIFPKVVSTRLGVETFITDLRLKYGLISGGHSSIVLVVIPFDFEQIRDLVLHYDCSDLLGVQLLIFDLPCSEVLLFLK